MITVIIIAITCIVSILCFNGALNGNKLIFNAYQVWHRKEWYRMLTSGIIHSGWGHLFFNMLTLYFFGRVVEQYFSAAFGGVLGAVLYVVLYVSALAISSLGDLVKYRDNWNTRCIRSSIRRPVCIDTLRAENGNLHLPDPYPGPWIYIRTIVSTILLVHGEEKHGQYRAHRTFLGRSLRDTVPDYL